MTAPDTDPRSDDTLAKALWQSTHGGSWELLTESDRAPYRKQAAHPAMQARDAALVQQGRDEGEAEVPILNALTAIRDAAADERVAMHERGEPLTDYSSGVLDGIDKARIAAKQAALRPTDDRTVTSVEEWWACDDAYEKGLQQGRDEVAAAVEAARRTVYGNADGDYYVTGHDVRAAVAAAGASDLATIRAEAIREWVNGWPCKPGDGSFLGDVARDGLERADRVAAEAGER